MLKAEFCVQVLLFSSIISWFIVMLAIIKTMSYFRKFETFKDRNDTELNIIAGYMKKIHEQMVVITSELKRSNRLLSSLSSEQPVGTDHLNYVDDGIYRELRHEDIKIEMETKDFPSPPKPAKDTQPVPVSGKAPVPPHSR